MFSWLREWYSIKDEFKHLPEPCESCETLKMQLSIANEEKRQLLDRILTPPTIEPPVDKSELKPISTSQFIPWKIRQQLLEAEDRKKAELMKQQSPAIKVKIDDKDVEKLENEVLDNEAS